MGARSLHWLGGETFIAPYRSQQWTTHLHYSWPIGLGLGVCFNLLLGPVMGATSGEQEWESRAKLHESPSPSSPVETLLTRSLPSQVVAVNGGWLQVKQGDSLGWMRAEALGLQDGPLLQYPCGSRLQLFPQHHVFGERSSPDFGGGLFTKLQLDSLVQDRELIDKMKHPFYRDRFFQFHRQWGFVYYVRTQFFYVKGIRLAEFRNRRFRLNLAKRRIFYKDIHGELWSEDVMRQLVRAQPGLLGSEVLFAKGQQYYLELALVF